MRLSSSRSEYQPAIIAKNPMDPTTPANRPIMASDSSNSQKVRPNAPKYPARQRPQMHQKKASTRTAPASLRRSGRVGDGSRRPEDPLAGEELRLDPAAELGRQVVEDFGGAGPIGLPIGVTAA
jgi:hypothetical protein